MPLWDIKRRFCSIKLYFGRNDNYKYQKEYSDWLDSGENSNTRITFQTDDTLAIVQRATITIYNLTKTQIERLAITTNMWSNKDAFNNQIYLYAGYIYDKQTNIQRKKDKKKETYYNSQLIFSGNIIETKTDLSSPNFSITLTAQARVNDLQRTYGNVNVSMPKDTKIPDVLNVLANTFTWTNSKGKKAHYKYEVHPACQNLQMPDYNFTGNLKDHLQYINSSWLSKAYCFIEGEENNIIFCQPTDYGFPAKKPFTVSYKTNLIGSVQPTQTGFECDITLTPNIEKTRKIYLDNASFPRLNSQVYTLLRYSHSGDTYGNTWKTHLVCIKEGIGEV